MLPKVPGVRWLVEAEFVDSAIDPRSPEGRSKSMFHGMIGANVKSPYPVLDDVSKDVPRLELRHLNSSR